MAAVYPVPVCPAEEVPSACLAATDDEYGWHGPLGVSPAADPVPNLTGSCGGEWSVNRMFRWAAAPGEYEVSVSGEGWAPVVCARRVASMRGALGAGTWIDGRFA